MHNMICEIIPWGRLHSNFRIYFNWIWIEWKCAHDLCCNVFIISHFSLPFHFRFVSSKKFLSLHLKFHLTYVNSDLSTIIEREKFAWNFGHDFNLKKNLKDLKPKRNKKFASMWKWEKKRFCKREKNEFDHKIQRAGFVHDTNVLMTARVLIWTSHDVHEFWK